MPATMGSPVVAKMPVTAALLATKISLSDTPCPIGFVLLRFPALR